MTEVVEDIIPPVSNSEIQVFKDCKRRWYLQHYREMGVRKQYAPIVGALRFGSKVHLALEDHYAGRGDAIERFEELHAEDLMKIEAWEAETGFIDEGNRQKLQKDRELGHAMLEGYFAWVTETGADEGLQLVGAETIIEVASGIPGVKIRGKLDQRLIREIDNARLFLDYKTAGNLHDGPMMLPIDEQMKFYLLLEKLDALARNDAEPVEPTIGGLYRMLKKVKRTAKAQPPFYDTVEIHHNSAELRSMYKRTTRVISEMLEVRRELDAGGDHQYWAYPRPSHDCKWKCPFLGLCAMMDDGSAWEEMLHEHFERVDPYERYTVEDRRESPTNS
jgi:RecB family exonuclease